MKTAFRLLRLASAFKWWMLLAALLGFLTVGSGIGLLMTSAYIISKAALHPSVAELQVGIVGVRFFGISRGIFRYLERLVSHDTTFRILTKFRVWFYTALEPLAPARLQKFKSADLLNRIVGDVQTLEHFYVRILAPPMVALGISVLMWILLGVYNPAFSFAILFFHLMAGLAVPVVGYLYSNGIGKRLVTYQAEMNVLILDYLNGLSELVMFGRDAAHREKIHTLNIKIEHQEQKMARVSAMHDALIGLLMNGAVLLMLILAIPAVNNGSLDGVYLAVISLGIMASFEALLPLPESLQFLEKNLQAADRLFEIIDAKAEIQDLKTTQTIPNNTALDVKQLSFAYDSKSEQVLKNISMQFPAGSKTAIVGPSGSGKSTILNLLLRFWEYTTGDIFFSGTNIKKLDQDKVRRQFAVVSQNSYLFNDTVYENLHMADMEAGLPEIRAAADRAHIHEFILETPDAYDTAIGEQGMRFSGGQRQRLAVARAILKDTPILLLDEATSNLDAETGKNVLDTILEVCRTKTIIHITHRLNDLDKFDTIYVLDKGSVVQSGTHYELLKAEGLYRDMWRIQNQIFEEKR